MSTRFLERAEKELLRKVSMIAGEIRDPRLDGLYSLSRVSLSPDFSVLKCYFAINGTQWKIDDMMDALKKAAPFIRKRLARCVRFKKIPAIHIYYDETPDTVTRMDSLFAQIHADAEDSDNEQSQDTSPGAEADYDECDNSYADSEQSCEGTVPVAVEEADDYDSNDGSVGDADKAQSSSGSAEHDDGETEPSSRQ